MPTNEFEKKVQQQLEDFQLNPSASVWKKVEEQIREKKKRRFIFFFLFPLAIGLLGFSFYHFLYTGKKSERVQQPVTAEKNSFMAGQNTKSKETKDQPVTNRQEGTGEIEITNTEKKITVQKPGATRHGDPEFSKANTAIRQVRKNTSVRKNSKTIHIPQDISLEIIGKVQAGQKAADFTDERPSTEESKKFLESETYAIKNAQRVETGIAEKELIIVKKDSIKTEEVTTTDNTKEPLKLNKPLTPKIKWGIDFSVGLAFNNKGTLTFTRAKAFDRNYTSSSSTAGPGSLSVIIPPSSVASGPAFKVGVTGEFLVSGRSRVSVGLQYVYAGNRIRTGEPSDTVVQLQSNNFSAIQVDRIYRGVQKQNYTNSYHFVSIPVWYHLQINQGKKLPMQWNTGISVSYMIATNALVYDGTLGGIYYQNKVAFTKLHFNLGTGLSFRIRTKNRSEWVIGPELTFDMSRLVKNDNKQYLTFGGMNAKLFLPKKKNK